MRQRAQDICSHGDCWIRAAQQNGHPEGQPTTPRTPRSGMTSSAVSLTESMLAAPGSAGHGAQGSTNAGVSDGVASGGAIGGGGGAAAAQTPAAALLGLRVSTDSPAKPGASRPPHGAQLGLGYVQGQGKSRFSIRNRV